MKTTGRVYATCRCCGRSDETVEYRPRNAPRQSQRPLCLKCWDDPALAYVDCKHGLGAAAQ